MNVTAAMNEVMRSISDLLVFPIDVGYMLYSLHVSMEGRCACQRYILVINVFWLFIDSMAIYSCLWLFYEFV